MTMDTIKDQPSTKYYCVQCRQEFPDKTAEHSGCTEELFPVFNPDDDRVKFLLDESLDEFYYLESLPDFIKLMKINFLLIRDF